MSELVTRHSVTAGALPGRRLTLLVLLALILIPLSAISIPPMCDYINHIAGYYVTNHIADDPLLAKYYATNWKVIPNLGTDLLSALLIKVMSVYALGRLYVALSMFLMVTGAFAIQYALLRRVTFGPFLTFAFIYCDRTLDGMLNFTTGLGVCYWAIAGYIWLRNGEAWRRFAYTVLTSVVLFFWHMFVFGTFGLMTMCFELWLWSQRGWDPRYFLREAPLYALSFLLPLLPLLAMSPTTHYAFKDSYPPDHSAGFLMWFVQPKVEGIYMLFRIYYKAIDLAYAIISIVLGALALWRGWFRLHPVAWVLLGISIPLFIVMPNSLMGSAALDQRFPTALLFVILGMTILEIERRREVFAAILFAVVVFRAGESYYGWLSYRGYFGDMLASFQKIDRGSKVLVTRADRPDLGWEKQTRIQYTPCLALIERSALCSIEYTHPGHHPIVVKPDYADMTAPESYPPVVDKVLKDEPPGLYYDGWRKNYDFLYVLNSTDKKVDDTSLTFIMSGGEPTRSFSLYKVNH